MLGCQDWQGLLELSPGSTTPGYNGKRTTATSAQHVTKITEAGFNIKQSSIYIYLCDWSAINIYILIDAEGSNGRNLVFLIDFNYSMFYNDVFRVCLLGVALTYNYAIAHFQYRH